WVDSINEFLWGPVAFILLAVMGIYLMIGTKFVHIRKLGYILKKTVGGSKNSNDDDEAEGVLTSTQSLFTSLASVIGMGSIVGVASALISGGTGALIWMWIATFVGMIIKYAEIILIVRYRKKTANNEYVGGPGLYVKEGLNVPVLGTVIVIMLVFAILSSTMIQSNVIVENVMTFLPTNGKVSVYILSILNVILVGFVLVGGIKRVGRVAEKLVPIMSALYLIIGFIVIIANAENIIPAFQLIFKSFFNPNAIGGGVLGYGIKEAMQYGVARGFFVSGAGQSIFTVSHAPAKVKNPVDQAIYAITELFLVTIIATMTGLTVLTSIEVTPDKNAATLVNTAFNETSPILGVFVGIAIVLFAYSTVLGVGYVGDSQLKTVFSANKAKKFRYVFLIFTFIGGIGGLKSIWDVTDLFIGIVLFLNLIIMLLMSKEIFKISNEYWSQL